MFTCPRGRANPPFHVGIHDFAGEFRLAIEGPFTSAEIPEVESRWRTAESIIGTREFRVDLDGVTSADDAAISLLRTMHLAGARFTRGTSIARRIAGEIIGQPAEENAIEKHRVQRLFEDFSSRLACLALHLRLRAART